MLGPLVQAVGNISFHLYCLSMDALVSIDLSLTQLTNGKCRTWLYPLLPLQGAPTGLLPPVASALPGQRLSFTQDSTSLPISF